MHDLIVHLYSEKVGTLRQDSSGLMFFQYVQEWLDNEKMISLSRSLPLQKEEFNGKQTRPFFAGILPEAAPREIISRILGISNNNDFALLTEIGGECAGAVSLLPEGVSLHNLPDSSYREITDSELKEIIMELPRRPLMAGEAGIRLSLAGAQDKLPVVILDKNICLPLGNTPSTHILKPEPDRFPGLVVNELFCMKLAEKMGFTIPEVEFLRIGDKDCLVVQRYDRNTDENGNTGRLHQEDFCQALGLPPEQKYQQEGGPALKDCFALLKTWPTAPAKEIPQFINLLIFNVLIGNADAHGKNYSFLYQGKKKKLAPFYDLVSTIFWPELSKRMAMKIGGSESINAFNIGNWKKMANLCEISWPMLRELLSENCQKIRKNIEVVISTTTEYNAPLVKDLTDTFLARTDKLNKALKEQKI